MIDFVRDGPEEQAEFQEMMSEIFAAIPEEATAADIGNIIAAIVTEFVTAREDIHGIFHFGMHVAFTEAERMKNEGTVH